MQNMDWSLGLKKDAMSDMVNRDLTRPIHTLIG